MTGYSDGPGSRSLPRTTRRGVLALAGATVLSGCGFLPGVGGDGGDRTELDGDEVATVASGTVPSVPDPLPVDVTDAHVTASRERAESALASVPLPLSADELPNGVMRAEIEHEAEHARDHLPDPDEDLPVESRLSNLRDARESARFVAAAWAYAEDELTPADVRGHREAVVADAREFRADWEYVGDDVVRALLVHDTVESWTGAARRAAEPDDPPRPEPRTPAGTAGESGQRSPPTPRRPRPEPTNALTVGERAGEVENGRAYVDDARHVGEQFRASLSDPPSIRATLTDARESLTATFESRRADLPTVEPSDANDLVTVDRDLERSPGGDALETLYWEFPDSVEATDDLASDVLDLTHALANADAFASLRERIANGEQFTVESVADLRDRRSAAVTAIEDALAASTDRRLARKILEWAAYDLTYADRELRRYDGESVSARSVDYEVSEYVAAAALARAVPDACAATLDALGVEG